ncbi:MAG: methyltransferase domain-containing protein [Gammaproteobacteria bacterium]|nr:methyltransferase domain-containing protein [Gammaproteobacteria bacterium]
MFAQRSEEKEILDLGLGYYTQIEYEACMKKLFVVNQFFGFFYSTRSLLKKFTNLTSIADIGCGSGLFLLNLSQYFPEVKMHGIDISAEAIDLANSLKSNYSDNVNFNLQELSTLEPESVDVVISTLVCHHLSHDELVKFFNQTFSAAKQAVIINDLHRHKLAYFFYKIMSPIFRNKLIYHDGLISIRRGFTRKELQLILQSTSIKNYQIKWCFPFRWRIILWKK